MLPEIKNKKKSQKKSAKVVISNKVKDHGNDPFFIKKARESKEFLEKHGFPKELLIKR
jgi:hypothetical protein